MSEYDISGMLQDPQSNVQNIQVYPAKYRGQLIFPYGVTMLRYVATNEVGVTANCTMDINVRGRLVARRQAKINFDLSVKGDTFENLEIDCYTVKKWALGLDIPM